MLCDKGDRLRGELECLLRFGRRRLRAGVRVPSGSQVDIESAHGGLEHGKRRVVRAAPGKQGRQIVGPRQGLIALGEESLQRLLGSLLTVKRGQTRECGIADRQAGKA